MNRRFGFTLIELLVVIAIIALLMSILMPALSKTRKMTRATMCISNLKQWGSFFSMYTDDFEGSFMGGRNTYNNWWIVLEPYYKDKKLLLCPMADNPNRSVWKGDGNFGVWSSWQPGGFLGSYCINEWVCNPQFAGGQMPTYGDNSKYWRSNKVKGQSRIPLLGDGWWDQSWAEAFDWIPTYPGELEGVTGDDIAHFVIIRHGGYIHMLYMDYSVKKVHLRDLWPQQWNRLSDMEDCPTAQDFPDWLKKL